jgi:eukaryotic-like serine/threonine-protein kinase
VSGALLRYRPKMESIAAQQPSRIALGDGGRYALKACLSRSAAASVYSAFDVRLSREVVIKMLKTTRDRSDAHAVAHAADLLAGVRLMSRLQHPGMVTLFDAGLCGLDVYIAMERLEGGSLHDLLATGWRPTVQQALRVGARIAAALAFAHEAGALHGRVETGHVFLIGPTQIKLLCCDIVDSSGRSDMSSVDVFGEPPDRGLSRDTAPEVLLGAALDARCDVYGLGLMLYEMLAGCAAFSGDSPLALRNAMLLSDVPEAHMRNPNVPHTLSSVVARAMTRDPALRYQSMRELLDALKTELTVTGPTQRGVARDHRLLAAATCAGLLAASAAGYLVWRESAAPTPMAALAVAASEPVAAASTSVPVQPRSTPPPGERIALDVASSAVRPLAQIREAASASNARARTLASVPKTAAAPIRPTTPPSISRSTNEPVDPPMTATPARQPEANAEAARPAQVAASGAAPAEGGSNPAAAAARGAVIFAVEPGGAVEINGVQIGTTPPLRRLTLPNGKYEVTIRNDAFQPHVLRITVSGDKPVQISHRFGS